MVNKILIIGHDSSYSKNITNALHNFGLEKAMLSYTYQMTPKIIGEKLLSNSVNKRISRPSLNDSKYNPYRQRTPKKNWNSLAFDLLLANSDQSFWGWTDSNAISLLEFWSNFDEDMGFIIIYDNPKYIIKKLIDNKNVIDENSIQKNIEDWLSYHQVLLEFYQKNSNRCLLINGEQALQSMHDLLDLITKKIIYTHKKPLLNYHIDNQYINDNLTKKTEEENGPSINNIIDFFIEKLLQCDTKISSLFNEMQNISDISLVKAQSTNQLTLEELLKSSVELKQQQEDRDNKEKKRFSEKEIYYQEKINNYEILLNKKQIQQGSLDNNDINILKLQLSIALEELTELYSQPKQLNNIEYTNNYEQIKIELYNIKNQLKTYQKENILLTNQLNYTKEEYKMLNIQLSIALNELEHSFSQKTEKSVNNNVAINNIITASNLETNRIKNQLSYKIGKKILESSKNPLKWPILPISPIIAYYEYKGSLPFLDLYQDQYEDEKVKKHLSYKLGNYFLKNIKKPLKFLFIPFGLAIIAAKHKR